MKLLMAGALMLALTAVGQQASVCSGSSPYAELDKTCRPVSDGLKTAPQFSNTAALSDDRYVAALKAENEALRTANEANKNLANLYRDTLCAVLSTLKEYDAKKKLPFYCEVKK